MSEHRHVNYVRILRIDDDAGDRLRILEAHLREGLAAIGRFIDAVAEARTLAVIGLAGPYPNDVGIRRRNGDVPNRSSRIGVENRRESRAVIDGFPDSAGRKAHVVSIWVALYGGDIVDAPAHACRTDTAPHKAFQHRVGRPVNRRGRGTRRGGGGCASSRSRTLSSGRRR